MKMNINLRIISNSYLICGQCWIEYNNNQITLADSVLVEPCGFKGHTFTLLLKLVIMRREFEKSLHRTSTRSTTMKIYIMSSNKSG